MKPETMCVHAGSKLDPQTQGANTPVFTSTAYGYLDCDSPLYQRYFNTPNQRAVVEKLCALEGAADGLVCASGMAAISTALLAFLRAGDEVIFQDNLYGGTHAFAVQELPRLGIAARFAPTDAAAVCEAVTDRTRVIYLETPTNPLLRMIDLQAVAAFARERGVVTIADNTFASPINQQPLALGLDVVVHSGTKYLGGHSDLQCGAVLTREGLSEQVLTSATHLGGSLNAEPCYWLERSLKTLSLRVERQTANAARIAEYLSGHPRVSATHYPGLPGHPGHEIARAQMRGYGAMLSFELADASVCADDFMRRLHLIQPAISLGGVESTICSPAATSHAKVAPEARRAMGISDQLLRLSAGIENVDDLVEELEEALGG